MIGTSKLNGKVKTTIERTFIWVARILLIKSRVTFAEKKPKNNSKNKKLVNSSWKKGKKSILTHISTLRWNDYCPISSSSNDKSSPSHFVSLDIKTITKIHTHKLILNRQVRMTTLFFTFFSAFPLILLSKTLTKWSHQKQNKMKSRSTTPFIW